MISVAFWKKLEEADPKLRRLFLSLIEEIERHREESVTKKEFKELIEAQKRTEEAVNKLAEAQKKTEEEIAKLTKRMSVFEKRLEKVEERLEGISNSVGYSLENSSYKALPRLLEERFGIKIKDRLIRRYMSLGAKEIQINIYGEARKNGSEILILGECKVRPSKKEIARFEKYARRIAQHMGKEAFLVVVAHDFTPSIERLLREKGIVYFWSYEL